jgi:hypothetical protein
MRKYEQTFKVEETFPVELYDHWDVKQGDRVCESWFVVDKRKKSFTAEITEYFPV